MPCNGGVLEYGMVTADKRGSTIGPEFQESQRPYRRSVFNGPDWVNHRSSSRFEDALRTTLSSGILRLTLTLTLIPTLTLTLTRHPSRAVQGGCLRGRGRQLCRPVE